jgi:hypothetical protein
MPRGSGSVECGSNTVLIPASAAPNGSMIAAPRPARVYTRPGGAASERDGADSATADRWCGGRGPGTVGSEEDGEGVVTVMGLTLRFSVTSTRPASRPPSPASVPVATVEMSPSRQFVPTGPSATRGRPPG